MLASYSYNDDRLGRLLQETSVDGVRHYRYDPPGQLTRVSGDGEEAYSQNATGNRTGEEIQNGANNRLLDDGTYTYLYDDNGNRIRRTDKATGDFIVYRWDHRNQMTSVVFYDSTNAVQQVLYYRYDVFDDLITRLYDTDGVAGIEETEYYVHDMNPAKGGLNDIVLTFDEAEAVKHRYLHGPAIDQIFSDESFVDGLLWALADRPSRPMARSAITPAVDLSPRPWQGCLTMKLRSLLAGGGLASAVLFPAMCSPVEAAPPLEPWFSSCEGPILTCDQPRPSSVVEQIWARSIIPAETPARLDDLRLRLHPIPPSADPFYESPKGEPQIHGPRPIPEERMRDARAVLIQWQAATKSHLPATAAGRLRLAREQPGLSGFERKIAAELQGPIDADDLWTRFDWSVAAQADSLLLTAVPKDVLDQVLCDRFEVRLDADCRAATLAFPDSAARNWPGIVLNEREHRTGKIVPTSYEMQSTEPSRLRTAEIEDAVELTVRPTAAQPRLIRETSRLSLPLAPLDDAIE